LVGLIAGISAERFPSSHTFAVHATVADLREDMVAYFEIVDSEGEVIERSDDLALMRPESLLAEATIATFFEEATFWRPGDYFVRFWGNRQVIMERRLRVRRVPSGD
jgi:hypothetical protein